MQNDLRNKRFGSLTSIEPTDFRKNGYTVWRCRCDCGKEVLVESRRLLRGTVHDCGCGSFGGNRLDLRGRRFGRLTVIDATDQRDASGCVCWKCRCDCGNESIVSGSLLTKGYRKSCGCLGKPPLKDWINRQFGRLTVTAYAGKENGSHCWRCRCDCGNTVTVRQSNLKTGHTVSCGCQNDPRFSRHFVEGTCIESITSKTVPSNNKSGVRGVYWSRERRKWTAQITFRGKTYYLGGYDKLEDAVKARKQGEEMYDSFLDWYYSEKRRQADADDRERLRRVLFGVGSMTEELAGELEPFVRQLAEERERRGRIAGAVEMLRDFGHSDEEIKAALMKRYHLKESEARGALEKESEGGSFAVSEHTGAGKR